MSRKPINKFAERRVWSNKMFLREVIESKKIEALKLATLEEHVERLTNAKAV